MITNISAKNFKGQSFSFNTSALTIIAGPNNTGKTAIMEAAKLVLAGKLPKRTTAPDICALASGATMAVGACLGEKPYGRSWAIKNGKCSASHQVDGLPTIAPIFLDGAEFINASPQKRADLLMSLSKASEADWDRWVERALASVKAAGGKSLAPSPDENRADWVAGLIELAGDEIKTWTAVVKRFAGTQQGITTLSLDDDATEDVSAQLAAARDALAKVAGRQAYIDQRKREIAAAEAQRSQIKKQIEEIGPCETTGSREALEARLAEARAVEARLISDLQCADTLRREHNSAIAEAQRSIPYIVDDNTQAIEALEARVGSADAALLENVLDELDKEITKTLSMSNGEQAKADSMAANLKKIQQAGLCPCCLASGEQEVKNAIANLTGLQADAQEKARKYRDRVDELNAKISNVRDSIVALNQLRDWRRIQAARTTALKIATAKADTIEENEKAIAMLDASVALLNADLDKTRNEIQSLTSELYTWNKAQRVKDLDNMLKSLPSPEDVADDVSGDIERLKASIATLEAAQQRHNAAMADRKRIEQANAERESAEKSLAGWKQAKVELVALKTEIGDATIRPLLDIANHFTAGIIPEPLEMRDGEIGIARGANWVPLDAFGGSHLAVATCGLQAAIGSQSELRIAFIDEMGVMDEVTRKAFIHNLWKAVQQGVLDQAFCVIPTAAPILAVHENATVINTGKN